MPDEPERSRAARRAAEDALVRVVHHYGARPEFVVLGGLVPELLCAASGVDHAGTTDVDVQVDLEVACGAVNTRRLEKALLNAEFEVDSERIWRWRTTGPMGARSSSSSSSPTTPGSRRTQRSSSTAVTASGQSTCAARATPRETSTSARCGHASAGRSSLWRFKSQGWPFLLAKTEAARSRYFPKDFYDIAFVLLHNDAGGPLEAARAVLASFTAPDLVALRTGLAELRANFANPNDQGAVAYADQMLVDHPDLDRTMLLADAVAAIDQFCTALGS